MGAGLLAAVVILKERAIVAAFRDAGATSAATATTPAALGVHEGLAFRKLRRRAVLREAGQGLFYLDEQSWEALRRIRRQLAVAVAILALVAAAAYLLRRLAAHS
ncbi:MAG: hypothetical protein HYR73_01465 [Candidatus Eisenbacteria bacterium]|nr:hypothetical protein [Candidatus Eisenbacteria bacterium]